MRNNAKHSIPIPSSKIDQFCRVAVTTSTIALHYLKEHQGQLEPALNAFFVGQHAQTSSDTSSSSMRNSSLDRIQALFNKYKDPKSEKISIEGLSQLCEDIQIDPDDSVLFALAYHCGAQTVGEFSKHEFTQGLLSLSVESLSSLKSALTISKEKLQSDATYFKSIYEFVFVYSRDV
ncbi:hypothetical protein HMI54_011650, partial [Coelomomyces lativittatus]